MVNVCLDTNLLMNDIDLNQFDKVYICATVLEELDKHKESLNNERAFKARRASRKIQSFKRIKFIMEYDNNLPIYFNLNNNDNMILAVIKKLQLENKNIQFLTGDLNLYYKALSLNLNTNYYEFHNSIHDNCDYSGYKEIEFNHQELADFYNDINKNRDYGLKEGQYLLIKDSETKEIVDKYKYSDNMFKKLKYTTINNKAMGKIKPRNIQQELLFDMLQDDTKTVLACIGGWGTGKDFCMLSHAFQLIDKRKFEKLIFCRNNIDVKNSNNVGFLKGTLIEKLMPYAQIMSDHLGGQFGLNMMLDNGTIELQHLGFLRGRDIKNSIIYCSEAENMTKEHIQLLIGRVGEGSIIMFNGDFKQIDAGIFEVNNGLSAMIDKFKGHKNFGLVKLLKTERSETAAMADLLD